MASYLLPLVVLADVVAAVNNGLAVTPAMGWNDWNAFGCGLSQSLVLNTATTMKKIGLQDVGYHYVVLDDCWSSGRSSSGTLVADSNKFPNGMAYIGNQLHAQGFGFGMYSDAGSKTCGGYAGSRGYETNDAKTFASWGVDYLKYDNCNNGGENGSQAKSSARYQVMASALAATGRAILYSICNWGEDSPWVWGPSIGNSWRISGDIHDSFDSTLSGCPLPGSGGYECSVVQILAKTATIASAGAKGGWNDLDMLEVGNGGMSDDSYVAHFSTWAAVKSPLIMGTDITKIKPQTYSILANPAVIAVSQDPLGIPASNRWTQGTSQLWSGPLVSTTSAKVNDMVVILLNNAGSSATISATMSNIFGGASIPAAQYQIYDLWGGRLSTTQAQNVINSGSSAYSSLVYNSTSTSYASGLAAGNSLLFGTSAGTVASSGSVSGTVPAKGCRVFRLRAVATGGVTTTSQGAGTTITTITTATTTKTQQPTTTTSAGGATQSQYGQCGGLGYTGPTACQSPYTCKYSNDYYSQCL